MAKKEKKNLKEEEKQTKKASSKKKTGEKKTSKKVDSKLPQNILQMGDHVEQDKKIYISQSTYKKIQRFTRNKTKVEAGGMLIGSVVEELGQQHILIEGFVEAKDSEGTATTLTFTHKTWDYVHKEREKKFPDKKIVGWIHTHPDFGIFLSDYDKFIHENFFSEENQVAYVVDPIRAEEGFYFWINGSLERCKGFFIYDKGEANIEIKQTEKKETTEKVVGTSLPHAILTGLLCVAVVFLAFTNLSMNRRINKLEKKDLVTQQTITTQEQTITALNQEITALLTDIESKQTEIQKEIDFIWEHEGYPELNSSEETETETTP